MRCSAWAMIPITMTATGSCSIAGNDYRANRWLFRVNMDMNYDRSYTDLGYAFYWMTLDMSYRKSKNSPQKTPSLYQSLVQGFVSDSLSYITLTIDPYGDPVKFTFSRGSWLLLRDRADQFRSGAASHAWCWAGPSQVTAKVADSNGENVIWSTYLTINITAKSPPRRPLPPAGIGSGLLWRPYSFKGYASDSDRDQIFYTFDWRDGNTSQTDLVNLGASVHVQHTWSQAGVYLVRGHGHRQQ